MNDKTSKTEDETLTKATDAAPALSATDACLFAGQDVIRHEVELPTGTAIVFVAELPDKQLRTIMGREGGYDRAELIAKAIRDENGKTMLSQEQAGKLKPKVAFAFEKTILKANGLGKSGDEGNE